MGVVWRAVDTSLDREVAIKLLPDALAADPERLARFEREARLLASLSHPGIAAVYGLHEAQAPAGGAPCRFIAMELVPGEDLAQHLARRSMAIDETLAVAYRIAEALEAAHENGVIHRDLKPANVKLTEDGKVKVLDFGLAKAFDRGPASGSGPNPSMSPTLTGAGTAAGMILGTAAYMSPEQAKGKQIDRRADIWAFGVLLAEMLTGKRLFDAESVSETLAQVLMTPVDLDALPARTPSRVRGLIARCLERDANRRLRDIGEARIVLEDVRAGTVGPGEPEAGAQSDVPTTRAARGSGLVPWIVAIVAAAVAVGAWVSRPSRQPTPVPTIVSSILPPPGAGFDIDKGLALSPDGTRLVFPARESNGPRSLWIRELDDKSARMLEGTDGAEWPFWSPDGRHVAFFVGDSLRKVAVASGLVETLAEASSRGGGMWTADGHIVLSAGWGGGLQKIPVGGGPAQEVVAVLQAGTDTPMWPSTLPDGRHFVYLLRRYGSDQQSSEIRLGSTDGSTDKLLLRNNSRALYAEPGYLLWWQGGNLRAQRFDTGRLELIGEARSVIPNVRFAPHTGHVALTASANGLLAYQEGGSVGGDELVVVDRRGALQRTVGEPGSYYGPRISPDGRRIAMDVSDDTNRGDIWLLDLARASGTRLTFFSEDDSRARWSPDGRQIAFTSAKGQERFAVWLIDSRAGAEPRLLVSDPQAGIAPLDWASNGVLLLERFGDGQTDLYLYSFDDEQLRPWVATPFQDRAATASPDARFAAYVTDETGRPEVWVQTFPEPGDRWRVSVNGGDWPAWRPDGREIYYVDPQGGVVAVPVELGDGGVPRFGEAEVLFRAEFKTHPDRQFEVLDRNTFLLNRLRLEGAEEPLTLVQGWHASME